MAQGKQIKYSDLVDPKAFAQLNKDIKLVNDTVKLLVTDLKAIKTSLQGNPLVTGRGSKKFDNEIKKTISITKDLTTLEKQKLRLNKQLSDSHKTLATENAALNDTLRQQKRVNQEDAKIINNKVGTLARLSVELAKQKRVIRETINFEKKLTAAEKQQIKTMQTLDAKVKRLDRTLGNHQRNVGNYRSVLKGLGSQMLMMAGVGGGLYTIVNVFKSGIKTIREFGKQNAILAGVLGITRKATKALQEKAVSLGAIYPILTSEVTALQIAYARLGFSEKDILNLTEDTILGSIALNSELGETAELVGAVVKSFDNLSSANAGEIMDELTRSTTLTSLNFTKLSTALPKVMGAANAMNIPLGKTLSLLGIAQDATQDASIAGTSLRNIFIKLAKDGQTLEDGLGEIISSENKLTTATEKYGKRAAVTALALANNIEKIGQYNTEITTATGLTQQIADEQMNTLDGALKRVEGAWESLVLSMRNSEGVMKGTMEWLADTITLIKELSASEIFATIAARIMGVDISPLFKIPIEQRKKAKEELKTFYQVMDKTNEEGLLVWLNTTNAARMKEAAAGNAFEASELLKRQVYIAQRIQLLRKEVIAEDIIVGTGQKSILKTLTTLEQLKTDRLKIEVNKRMDLRNKENIHFNALMDDYFEKEDLKQVADQKAFQLTSQIMGLQLQLMKDQGDAYKIFATAKAAIDTWGAANAALNDPAPIPYWLRAINAASAVIIGLGNVAQINKIGFAEGTERVTGGEKGKDSVNAWLMPGERVIPTDQNKPLLAMGISNAEIPGLVALGIRHKIEGVNQSAILQMQLAEQIRTTDAIKNIDNIYKNETGQRVIKNRFRKETFIN